MIIYDYYRKEVYFMKLTKAEAIANHRKMWNWIADETLRRKKFVDKDDYFETLGITSIPRLKCYCCDYDYNFINMSRCEHCPIDWNSGSFVLQCMNNVFFLWMSNLYNYKEAAKLARQIANLPERKLPNEK